MRSINLDLLIPTYNRARLLGNCLESVLRATRPKGLYLTITVIDNGSSDGTKGVVDSFVGRPNACIRSTKVVSVSIVESLASHFALNAFPSAGSVSAGAKIGHVAPCERRYMAV